jgi:hypothetical protein
VTITYLDQNAVIDLGVRARRAEFRQRLDAAIGSGAFIPMVSSWHLIETANTTNLANATELAEFIDSLKAVWLLERRTIQRLDVQEDFWKFLKVDYPERPRVKTRSAVIAAMNGAADAPKYDIPSRDFVKQWIGHPEQLTVLKEAYASNSTALAAMRDATKAGKVTQAIRRRANQEFVRPFVPASTPAGVAVGSETIREYIDKVDLAGIPSLAIETAIADREWTDVGGSDANTLIDKFHLISAMPYADEIVSRDNFFHKVFPIALGTGHVRAQLVDNVEFLKRF